MSKTLQTSRLTGKSPRNESASGAKITPKYVIYLAVALFQLATVALYELFVVEVYTFKSLLDRDYNVSVIVLNAIICLLPAGALCNRTSRPSDWTVWILYLNVVASLFYIGFANWPGSQTEFQVVLLSVVAAFGLMLYVRSGSPFRFKVPSIPKSFLNIAIPTFVIGWIIYIGSLAHWNLSLSLWDSYDRRDNARVLLVSGNALISYISVLASALCLIVMPAFGVREKKPVYILGGLVCGFLLYAIDGSKGSVLAPLLTIILLYTIASKKLNSDVIIIALYYIIVIVVACEIALFDNDFLLNYIFRRLILVPQELTAYYWDHTIHNGYMWFRDSSLLRLANVEPAFPIARLIGEYYYGSVTTNANANIFASAYAQASVPGLLFTASLAGLLLRALDSLEKGDVRVLSLAIGIHSGNVWSNGALHTSLLSNGLIALYIVAMLFPQSREEKSVATLRYRPT